MALILIQKMLMERYILNKTALHMATENGDYLICKILIWDVNTDITLKTNNNLTALQIAKRGENIDKQLEYKSIITLLKDYMNNNKTTQDDYITTKFYNKIKFYGENFKYDKYLILMDNEMNK